MQYGTMWVIPFPALSSLPLLPSGRLPVHCHHLLVTLSHALVTTVPSCSTLC